MRHYHLPLSKTCANSCNYCSAIGNKIETRKTATAITASLEKAVSGNYRAVLLPCNWESTGVDLEEFSIRLRGLGLKLIVQINLDSSPTDEVLSHLLQLDVGICFIASHWSPRHSAVAQKFSKKEWYITFIATRGNTSLATRIASLPFNFYPHSYFEFPLPINGAELFYKPEEVRREVLALRRLFSGVPILPPPGTDLFEPRITEDRNLEPNISPRFESRASTSVKISIIIPSYNNRAYLKATLRHLYRQTLNQSEFEIIVVDDGSTDGTEEEILEQVRSYFYGGNFLYLYFPRTRPRKMGDSQFRAGIARNLGVKHARGKYLFFLDSDILLPPHYLQQLLNSHKSYSVIQGKRLWLKRGVSSEFTRYQDVVPESDTYITDEGYWHRFQSETIDWDRTERKWRYVCTFALSMPKDLFMSIGWIKKNYTYYGYEDTELGFRLSEAGAKFHLLDLAVYHLDHKESRSEFFQSHRKKLLLLNHSAVTFYHNTLDDGVYQHLEWLFQPLLPQRIWFANKVKFLLPFMRPFWKIYYMLHYKWAHR